MRKQMGTALCATLAAVCVGAPFYGNGGRTLVIPVTANFTNDNTLVISGLQLTSLRFVPPGEAALELDFDGDGARDVYDRHSLAVRSLWPGGYFDGWDAVSHDLSAELIPPPLGTLMKVQ